LDSNLGPLLSGSHSVFPFSHSNPEYLHSDSKPEFQCLDNTKG
jgi:hypothetical protein